MLAATDCDGVWCLKSHREMGWLIIIVSVFNYGPNPSPGSTSLSVILAPS